jgi:hypothetical protein
VVAIVVTIYLELELAAGEREHNAAVVAVDGELVLLPQPNSRAPPTMASARSRIA